MFVSLWPFIFTLENSEQDPKFLHPCVSLNKFCCVSVSVTCVYTFLFAVQRGGISRDPTFRAVAGDKSGSFLVLGSVSREGGSLRLG